MISLRALKERQTGFHGHYDPGFEEDEWPKAKPKAKKLFQRLPPLVRFIVYVFSAAAGILIGFIVWLVVGTLAMINQ
jgi:hypothetical protein